MNFIFFHRSLVCAVLLALGLGAAASADSVTEGFDNLSGYITDTNVLQGWNYSGANYGMEYDRDTYKTARPAVGVNSNNTSNYLITPMLEGEFSFWLRNYTTKKQATIKAFSCTFEDGNLVVGSLIDSKTLSSGSSTWTNLTFTSPAATRVALLISQAYFDDFTYTPASLSEDPQLVIADFQNGDNFDFGTVPEGTEKVFTLINNGSGLLEIESISITGDFILVSGEDTAGIEAGKQAYVVVATPGTDTSGVLSVKSNDPASPYEINLTSKYKVPKPIMAVSPLEINFGKVTADVSDSFVISNSGDATLHVTIASENPAFEVGTSDLSIEPGQSESVTVSCVFESLVYGINNANITVTPSPGEGEAAVVAVSAKVPDPNLWEEDFEEGNIPETWTNNGWTIELSSTYMGNGTYMAYAGTSGNAVLVTPRLYATKDQVLSFEVASTDSTDPLTVEYSHDKNEWSLIDGAPVKADGVVEFVAPADGFYYLRFKGKYNRIDNFQGFKLSLKERDLSLVGQNIPKTGHQYADYTASITLKEMMGFEETATAVLMIGGNEMATATRTIAPNATSTISLSFTPEDSVDDADAVILVTYAENETLKSESVGVSIAAAPVWDEDCSAELEEGTLPAVVFNYTPVEGWNSISVPFALTDEYLSKIFGPSYQVFELSDFEDNVIKFREALKYDGKYAAGYPYMVFKNSSSKDENENENELEALDADSDQIVLRNVRVERTAPQSESKKGVTFSAVFSARDAEPDETLYEIDSSDRTLKAISSVKGFRGVISLDSSVVGVPRVAFYDGNGVETGVSAVEGEPVVVRGIFNLQGLPVEQPLAPGLYIIDGKKVFIK